jgi:uncharacterized SAM-binding protein YcdF (DUF218 family)
VLGWAVLVALLLPFVWYSVALFQVWRTARTDEAGRAQAIIVLGAAQYDGRPSPVLATRLEHTLQLWQEGLAPYIVVTGGRQPGDRFTEASASADWLLERGVPDDAILREVQGATTWESLAASARFLKERGLTDVLIVSDPYHLLRAKETAEEVGLHARTSPVPNSLVTGWAEKQHILKEAAGVAVARLPFVGYRRLLELTG